ncbi:hypothetical protein L596_016201 [Steinernema carpocapsae]|uniref:Uncharacterized protein n=1 Tax=Steinernema carpocapsae TaxID=34508 RepID=A0A4U5NIH7_STECR|nr:hypothetical protein L596_016201 [Steinernema carpocapsae]
MASVDVELREKTKIRQEADRMFKEDYGIDVGSTEMPAKMMKPAAQNTMSLVTNLFPVKTHQQMPIYRWDVDITIAGKNGKTFSLTKKSDSDAVAVNRKLKTRSISSASSRRIPRSSASWRRTTTTWSRCCSP